MMKLIRRDLSGSTKSSRRFIRYVLLPLAVIATVANFIRFGSEITETTRNLVGIDEVDEALKASTYRKGTNSLQTAQPESHAKPSRHESNQKSNDKSISSSPTPVIDVLSIGSRTKPDFQDAQEQTFGQHKAIRKFYRITEEFDHDKACANDLTIEQVDQVIDFCHDFDNVPSGLAKIMRKQLFLPNRHVGWLCAQKRPIDGLLHVLDQYKSTNTPFPDYLMLIDDDTFLNMDNFLSDLNKYNFDDPHLLTGCRYVYPKRAHFGFPYGGFSSIFSRKALENMHTRINCEPPRSKQDRFSELSCNRIHANWMGEQQFFRNNMTVVELMHEYTKELAFTNVDQWKDGIGYCFHSDHTLGYFLGFYPVSVPEHSIHRPMEKIRRQFGYQSLKTAQCKFEKDKCSADKSSICHYSTPVLMRRIHEQAAK